MHGLQEHLGKAFCNAGRECSSVKNFRNKNVKGCKLSSAYKVSSAIFDPLELDQLVHPVSCLRAHFCALFACAA